MAVEAAEEPMGAEPRGRPVHRRVLGFAWRWLRRGALLLLLGAGALVALYLTRDRTLHPLLVRWTPELTRAFTPFEVTVEGIEGDWTGTLQVTGLSLRPIDAEGPLRQARADAVSVTGDLLRAARSADLEALTMVTVSAPEVELDTTSLGGGEAPSESAGLPTLPPFLVSDGNLRLVTESDLIEISELA